MRHRLTAFALFNLIAVRGFPQTQTAHTAARPSGDATGGGELFQRQCVMCHSSEPDTKIVGPSLYHVMKGPRALTPRAVQEITANGKGAMPSFRDKLTTQQVVDLLAYLRTL